ncbi:transposase [Streptomyces sp. NPDC050619]|uniref:transposase n=1 Tax=Streptomyces sp. NPDC050619 TaxID=3157214 RepID=UPI00343814C6
MKHYPPEFKADAVALYQSRPGATIRSVAADLRANPETLRNWVRAAGASRPRGRRAEISAEPATSLEAENTALRKKVRELEEEREILRRLAAGVLPASGASPTRPTPRHSPESLCEILTYAERPWKGPAVTPSHSAPGLRLALRVGPRHVPLSRNQWRASRATA